MSNQEKNVTKEQVSSPGLSPETVSEPRDATDDEIRNLPHIVDRVPLAAWAAALIGAWERFGYYSMITIWRKIISHMVVASSSPSATFQLSYMTRQKITCRMNENLIRSQGPWVWASGPLQPYQTASSYSSSCHRHSSPLSPIPASGGTRRS